MKKVKQQTTGGTDAQAKDRYLPRATEPVLPPLEEVFASEESRPDGILLSAKRVFWVNSNGLRMAEKSGGSASDVKSRWFRPSNSLALVGETILMLAEQGAVVAELSVVNGHERRLLSSKQPVQEQSLAADEHCIYTGIMEPRGHSGVEPTTVIRAIGRTR